MAFKTEQRVLKIISKLAWLTHFLLQGRLKNKKDHMGQIKKVQLSLKKKPFIV